MAFESKIDTSNQEDVIAVCVALLSSIHDDNDELDAMADVLGRKTGGLYSIGVCQNAVANVIKYLNSKIEIDKPVDLQHWNGYEWVYVSSFMSSDLAWISLGDDNENYRTVNAKTGETIYLTPMLAAAELSV